jgi:hypothetical protein
MSSLNPINPSSLNKTSGFNTHFFPHKFIERVWSAVKTCFWILSRILLAIGNHNLFTLGVLIGVIAGEQVAKATDRIKNLWHFCNSLRSPLW